MIGVGDRHGILKMAIDGYVVKGDLPELRELVSLLVFLQQSQSAHAAGACPRARLRRRHGGYTPKLQERIWQAASGGILNPLAAIK